MLLAVVLVSTLLFCSTAAQGCLTRVGVKDVDFLIHSLQVGCGKRGRKAADQHLSETPGDTEKFMESRIRRQTCLGTMNSEIQAYSPNMHFP